MRGDTLRPGEDLCVFDLAVNSGPARAGDFWQRCGGRNRPLDDMFHDICAHRLSFLHALKTWQYFGVGWGRWVAASEALALAMAHGKASPEVLTKKAGDAKQNAGKKATQAAVAASVAGSVGLAHYLNTGGIIMAVAGASILALGAGIFFIQSRRQRQRAEALTSAVADLKAGHAEQQKTKAATAQVDLAAAEASQKAAVAANIDKQQHQLKTAEAAEAALRDAPAQSAPSAGNEELKK